MKQIEFSKINGKIADMGALHAWLDKSVKWLTNGRHTLEIKRSVKKRSLAQNKLMWLWFACIESETGQYAQDIHDYYCMKFLPKEIADLKTGEMVRVGGHTSTLTSEAFTDFLNKVQADAATELGITLPVPDDEGFSEFEDEYKQYAR
jgi:hypothetical protein